MRRLLCKTVSLLLTFAILTSFAVTFTAVELETMKVGIETDVPESEPLSLGDTFTVTVKALENVCIDFGTIYYTASDNITPVSATFNGVETELTKALDGDNEGAFGIIITSRNAVFEPTADYSSVTFRVTGLGFAEVSVYAYGAINKENVSVSFEEQTYVKKITDPQKPIVLTDKMSAAVLDVGYSFVFESDIDEYEEWEVSGLPEGLNCLSDGTVEGIPEEFGEFTIKARVSILGEIFSDEKQLTLIVHEKPQKLVLLGESKYSIEDGTSYLLNVVEKTTVSDAIAQFENSDFIAAYDGDGKKLEKDSIIGTGCTISLLDGGTAIDTVTVVVLGDVSGDGKITSLDYQMIRSYYLKTYNLTGAQLESAHVAKTDKVTSLDYQMTRSHYLRTYNIFG